MKKLLFLVLVLTSQIGFGQVLKNGNAEDLWGNSININDTVKSKTTVIIPFSTSNCGYCLVDGYFSKTNYLDNNKKTGGASFEQCLFNPQLDVYVFTKQFHSTFTVLTYPPELHKIHEDGFPTVLAFKNGKQVVKYHNNYAEFPKLNTILWDNKCFHTPMGNLHMAERLIFENYMNDAIMVYPDSVDLSKKINERLSKSVSWKHIGEITETDKQKHLYLAGNYDATTLSDFFKGAVSNVQFSSNSLIFGNYKFNFDSIGIYAWFTSPFNNQKYIVLNLRHGNKLQESVNYLDFVIYEGKDTASFKKILYGQYDIVNGKQDIIPQKTFSDVPIQQYCDKICRIPEYKKPEQHNVSEKSTIITTNNAYGNISTLGNGNCKFPDIICDTKGNVWTVFEENGDIILNEVESNSQPIYIESDNSDSYNPILASDNKRIWVFYLNNKDLYYRVYARYIENGNLSDEILISDKEPFNSSNLSAATMKDEISIVWTEWKANQRYLKLSKIYNGTLMNPSIITLAPSRYTEDYHNAWSASLMYDSKGELWGAWNQHYPGNFCVISGKIGDYPQPVTNTAKEMDDWEHGGYPDIATNGEKKIIVYESFGWDVVLKNESQKIKFREFNDSVKKWSVPIILSDTKETYMNQTPSVICDKNKDIYVIWSGRQKKDNSVWSIYIVVNNLGIWGKPILISQPGINARYPKIILNEKDNSIMASWQTGIGKEMKTVVMKIDKEQLKLIE